MKRLFSIVAFLGILLAASAPAWAQAGFISSNNSSTKTLANGAVFTGVSEDVSGYQGLSVTAFADQASATSGLSLQFSPDNVNWDVQHGYSIAASVTRTLVEPVQARYFRIVYTNGGVSQGAFRLQTIYLASPGTIPPFSSVEIDHLKVVLDNVTAQGCSVTDANTQFLTVVIETNTIRWYDDASTPTASDGNPASTSQVLTFQGFVNAKNFKAISTVAGGSTIWCNRARM